MEERGKRERERDSEESEQMGSMIMNTPIMGRKDGQKTLQYPHPSPNIYTLLILHRGKKIMPTGNLKIDFCTSEVCGWLCYA